MHGDGYDSDVHDFPAPLGKDPQVLTRIGTRHLGGQCATATFDRANRMISLCASMLGFNLHLIEPGSLELLAAFKLPMRPSTFEALITRDPSKAMTDSSGAYFYLDNEDRVVIADSRQHIRRIAHRQTSRGTWEFVEENNWDLSGVVPHDCVRPTNWSPKGECDPITGVMPDYEGRIWWITRRGRLGTLDPTNGTINAMQLDGEEIQNGFAVAKDGVYIVSDHAMYRFFADADGKPQVGWRELYDRGSARKVGSINQGSGTTPTLLGDHYVTVTDNSDKRINLLVYRRDPEFTGERLICKVPLFEVGASATDNSMIGWNRSIIIENNYGYQNAMQQTNWDAITGGIHRIDIREDESGCDVVWTSHERAPSVVPKFSTHSGLAYFYTFEQQPTGEVVWYLMALDYETGRTVFKIRTGVGSDFDNNWSAITLGPDGTAYVGTKRGFVAIRDGS